MSWSLFGIMQTVQFGVQSKRNEPFPKKWLNYVSIFKGKAH